LNDAPAEKIPSCTGFFVSDRDRQACRNYAATASKLPGELLAREGAAH
jgi:hypothetical protein